MTSTATMTTGTCAYCRHPGNVVPASLQPGTDRYQCADGNECAGRLEAIGRGAATLTRAEAAYAHLASFQRGDVVDVAGEEFFMPGTIDTPQQCDGDDLNAAYVLVRDYSGLTKVTVASLLGGMTVDLQNEVARGNVRYFDEVTWTAQAG